MVVKSAELKRSSKRIPPPVFLRRVSVGPIVESIQREGSLKPSTHAFLRVGEKHSRSERTAQPAAAQPHNSAAPITDGK